MSAALTTPISPSRTVPTANAFPWQPDNGDGTYKNPVIFADYSDPDAIRVGDDFYLVASSFNLTPGLPILHSRDLINWTIINHAIKHLPHPRYTEVQHGCGIWAPAIRHHAGKFWIFFPMPDEGIYLTTADHPAGQWSEPHLVQAGKGLIDPCPLWDDDGQAWLVHAYAGSRSGIKHILRVRPMAPDGSRLLGDGNIVFHDPSRHPVIEGPKFLKKDGWYYILAPAGGVQSGWQVVLRSRNILGPYEDKVVLEQGNTAVNGPHQGALIDLPNDEWWFLHFQDAGVYGRILHLQPVIWQDGWPLMGRDRDGNGIGEPVSSHAKPGSAKVPAAIPQTSDEFDSPALGRQWQWQANFSESWHSLSARPGWLRLPSQPLPGKTANLAFLPNCLTQKFPAAEFTVTTRLDGAGLGVGEKAGLIINGADYSYVAMERMASSAWRWVKVVCLNALNGAEENVEATTACPSASTWLRVTVKSGGICDFSFSDDGTKFVSTGQPFVAKAGRWIGATAGLFSLASGRTQPAGHADFDWFRFDRCLQPPASCSR